MPNYTVNKTIDCKGLSCPMPIVRTKKAIDTIEPGEVLEVLATDPGSVTDVKSWATRTGHQFIGTNQDEEVYKHYIRKANPDEVKPEQSHGRTITNSELEAMLSENPIIIDVREPMEYAFGHIPGARLVPFGQLEDELSALKQHANQDIYVVCRTGSRSDMACQILVEQGFANVMNVLPGMSAWTGELDKEH